MNIFVGKLGKSILFKRSSWGPIGGDNEAPLYYENLFHHNPDIQFYLLGCSDYDRLPPDERDRINKNGNVHDIWGEEWKKFKKSYTGPKVSCRVDYMDKWAAEAKASGLNMNAGIVFAGPNATCNIPFRVTKMKNPTEIATPIDMLALYAGPLVSYLNDYRVPYVLIVNDPRFFPFMAKDIFHAPSSVLSQYNETVQYKHRKTYTDNTVIEFPLEARYASSETIYLINDKSKTAEAKPCSLESFFGEEETVEEAGPIERDIKFLVVLNEGRPSRYSLLKENILDHIEDVDVYGHWNPETIGDDPRFKGSVSYDELQKMLPRIKYSYCIPIKPGWVTMKFWELLNHGVIPFLHPTYDSQNNLNAPEFLRVKDSKDLAAKIEFFENNPAEYELFLSRIQNMIKPEHRDGTLLNNIAINEINKIINK